MKIAKGAGNKAPVAGNKAPVAGNKAPVAGSKAQTLRIRHRPLQASAVWCDCSLPEWEIFIIRDSFPFLEIVRISETSDTFFRRDVGGGGPRRRRREDNF